MSVSKVSIATDINAPAAKVFDVVVDLQSYAEWLPDSGSFHGTTSVSEFPVKQGTTYIESSPSGIRRGKVLEFDRPSRALFHQPMQMNKAPEGVLIDIKVEVIFSEKEEGVTSVERNVDLGFPQPLLELKPAFESGASHEGARVMELLKRRVESLPRGSE
jgi:uncharacterized protein YndB with AHSA1/START domain